MKKVFKRQHTQLLIKSKFIIKILLIQIKKVRKFLRRDMNCINDAHHALVKLY
jgi:hypothetical protein